MMTRPDDVAVAHEAGVSEEFEDAKQPEVEEAPEATLGTSRLMLCNPGTAAEPLPDDIDLEELAALIRPGGHVTFHERAGGPAASVIFPHDDPRVKAFAAGVEQGRKEAASQAAQAGVQRGGVQNRFEHIEVAHFHF